MGRRLVTHRSDYVFLSYVAILLIFGLIMLTSAGAAVGENTFADKYFFIKRQLLFGVLPGVVAFFFFARLPYQMLKKAAYILFGISILLLLLVFIPGIGSSVGTGAKSWLVIAGFSFQPAEFAKLALIVFLAAYISDQGALIDDIKRGFLPTLALASIPFFLIILQPDIGTVSILFAIMFAMLFLANIRGQYLTILALAAIIAFGILIAIAPYRAKRFTTFLHPELDPQGIGYHINQATLAIGTGGLFGRGLGHSTQKFQYLPEVHADSIFAIIAEETGYVIAVALLLLYVLIAFRGYRIARLAPDYFSRLLVSGIVTWFVLQAFLNIGAMVGLMPLTGVPLPFVSHGGTALMIAMASVGIIANVSRHTELATKTQ